LTPKPGLCPYLGHVSSLSRLAGYPTHIIEVNAKKFDKLPEREKIKTLVHELMHIPKTFFPRPFISSQPIHRIKITMLKNF
jgi:hypothetical protein